MVLQLLDSKQGQIIISVILGLGLASIFRRVCQDGNCQIIEGPPIDEIENKIFKKNDKCFRYKAKNTTCTPANKPSSSSSKKSSNEHRKTFV